MTAPRPTLGHYLVDSLTHSMLITVFAHFGPEGLQEPHKSILYS